MTNKMLTNPTSSSSEGKPDWANMMNQFMEAMVSQMGAPVQEPRISFNTRKSDGVPKFSIMAPPGTAAAGSEVQLASPPSNDFSMTAASSCDVMDPLGCQSPPKATGGPLLQQGTPSAAFAAPAPRFVDPKTIDVPLLQQGTASAAAAAPAAVVGCPSVMEPKDMLEKLERVGGWGEDPKPIDEKCMKVKKESLKKKPSGNVKVKQEQSPQKKPSANVDPVVVNGKPLELGCSKCRGSKKGCGCCRDPSFTGRRGRSTYKPQV